MEDLLRALIQGGQPQSSPYATRSGGDPLAAVLQGLLGGVASQGEGAQAGPNQGGLDLGSLLQGVLGGAGQAPQGYDQQAGTGSVPTGLELASLLEGGPGGTGQAPQSYGQQAGIGPAPSGLDLASLLEGGPGGTGQAPQSYGQQAGTGAAPSGLDLGSLLGSLLQAILGGAGGLGGATQAPAASGAGGFGDVLGAVMGGGSSTMSSDPFLAPIVNGLAEKLGLPPQIVQAVVAFVMGKLLSNRLQPGAAGSGVSGTARAKRRRGTTLEGIRQKTNRRKRVTKKELRSSGLARELSAHTGLDRATAEVSLQEVLNQLGRQLGAGE